MTVVKRVGIFLLVAFGIFATVEFINLKIESANNWGVNMDFLSTTSAHTAARQTASVKTPKAQTHEGTKPHAVAS